MRSPRTRELMVIKTIGEGEMPAFLPMLHHHFQKAKPATGASKEITLTAPLDMLEMMGLPSSLISSIESIEVTYRSNR